MNPNDRPRPQLLTEDETMLIQIYRSVSLYHQEAISLFAEALARRNATAQGTVYPFIKHK